MNIYICIYIHIYISTIDDREKRTCKRPCFFCGLTKLGLVNQAHITRRKWVDKLDKVDGILEWRRLGGTGANEEWYVVRLPYLILLPYICCSHCNTRYPLI